MGFAHADCVQSLQHTLPPWERSIGSPAPLWNTPHRRSSVYNVYSARLRMQDFRLEELTLAPSERERLSLRILAQPTGSADAGASLLFVGELPGDAEKSGKILEILLEVFEHAVQIPTGSSSEEAIACFERGIANVNQALSSLAGEGHVEWVGSLHLALGLIEQDSLHLARCGQVRGFLLRQNQLIDILRTPSGEPETPLKAFANIVSGRIEPGDRLLVTTPQLLDYLSQEKIRRILLSGSPDLAKMEFTSLLSPEGGVDGSFAMVLMERVGAAEAPALVRVPTPVASVSEATSRRMAPRRSPSSRPDASGMPSDFPAEAMAADVSEAGVMRSLSAGVASPPRSVSSSSAKPLAAATRALAGAGASLKQLFGPKPSRRVASGVNVPPPVSLGRASTRFFPDLFHQMSRFALRIRRLPPLSQALFFGSILAVIVLAVSLTVGSSRRNAKQVEQAHTSRIASVQQDIKRASDMLLYKDEAGARRLLADAGKRLDGLVASGEASSAEAEPLRKASSVATDQIDRVTRLSALKASTTIATPGILGLLQYGDDRLAYSDMSVLVLADSTSSVRATVPEDDGGLIVRMFQDPTGNEAVALRSDGSFLAFDLVKGTFSSLTGPTIDPAQLAAGQLYNRNLYALDADGGRILKFSRSSDGFSPATVWTKDSALVGASSLAVDGGVYVLRPDGSVLHYFSGDKQSFALTLPSLAFSGATHLATSADNPRLILLDPGTSRISVFDKKTGVLLSQQIAPVFADALDLVSSPDGSKATVLTKDASYEVSL